MKAVVKKKNSHLSQKHRTERMDFVTRYKENWDEGSSEEEKPQSVTEA